MPTISELKQEVERLANLVRLLANLVRLLKIENAPVDRIQNATRDLIEAKRRLAQMEN